jgi:hypothetical protein
VTQSGAPAYGLTLHACLLDACRTLLACYLASLYRLLVLVKTYFRMVIPILQIVKINTKRGCYCAFACVRAVPTTNYPLLFAPRRPVVCWPVCLLTMPTSVLPRALKTHGYDRAAIIGTV